MKKVALPVRVGKAIIRELDYALPGPHTKIIYDNLSKDDAAIITQLRTGNARLNLFLAKIKATDSAIYACEAAPESIRHFLFSCRRWTRQRREMDTKCPGKEGNIRFFLWRQRTSRRCDVDTEHECYSSNDMLCEVDKEI